MASVKLAYMPQQETNRVFAQYSPVEPASRSNSAVGSGIWSSAPPATPQTSSSSFIGSAWGSPLAVPTPSNAAVYAAPPASSTTASAPYQSGPKLLADLTAGSEPVPDGSMSSQAAISAYPSTQSLSSSGSRLSSRHNSQTEANSPLAPSPTVTPGALSTQSSSVTGPPTGAADEIINTAIVVKNIPFAIKKEQLIEFMRQLGLPLPYAFNYHFDNGVFRGLAFANFTTADETAAVISTLNGRELGGRRLRVEYKKMLPFQERERIEREKRERRGQLEEQHQQGGNANANAAADTASTVPPSLPASPPHAHIPDVATSTAAMAAAHISQSPPMPKPDLNDAETLEMFSSLLVFKHDPSKAELIIPQATAATMNVNQTYVLGALCRQLDLQSASTEEHDIIISKHFDGASKFKADGGVADAKSYLSGIFRSAVATPAASPLARVNSAAMAPAQNLSALSALNRWNSVGNLQGMSGVGGMGMMPAQPWAPGVATSAPASSHSDAGSRAKYYETALHHGAHNGVDRRQ